MDTSDAEIQFDSKGRCHHCRVAEKSRIANLVQFSTRNFEKFITKIRRLGRHKKYDCLIGISGGLDSSYLAYQVKSLGLRPLAVHVDNGWNSELAVSNIHNLLSHLQIDLHTRVLDWIEFRNLQMAFLKSSTPDLEIPTDHAITATLYQIADRYGLRFILSGYNTQSEIIHPRTWSHGHMDAKYIKHIYRRFHGGHLHNFPLCTLGRLFRYTRIRKIQLAPFLEYIPYIKDDAETQLRAKCNWRPYEAKHNESVFTRFLQGYIYPIKFHFDKRRAHLSSLILSGQMTREQALVAMQKDIYPTHRQQEDFAFVSSKFEISCTELKEILSLPNRTFWHYVSYEKNPIQNLLLKTLNRNLDLPQLWALTQRLWVEARRKHA